MYLARCKPNPQIEPLMIAMGSTRGKQIENEFITSSGKISDDKLTKNYSPFPLDLKYSFKTS